MLYAYLLYVSLPTLILYFLRLNIKDIHIRL